MVILSLNIELAYLKLDFELICGEIAWVGTDVISLKEDTVL